VEIHKDPAVVVRLDEATSTACECSLTISTKARTAFLWRCLDHVLGFKVHGVQESVHHGMAQIVLHVTEGNRRSLRQGNCDRECVLAQLGVGARARCCSELGFPQTLTWLA
jgi:hypothetical protein